MKKLWMKLSAGFVALALAVPAAFGTGAEFYDHTTYPSQGSAGSSSAMRAELDLIEAGFGKLPDLAGNGGKVTAVNSGGTAIEAITTTGTGSGVRATSPTLTTPNLGTPSALVGTNITGTAAGLTAGNVTTNANLTGPITSTGNATAVAAQTGTGTTFVMQASPTLTTPNIGTPSAGVATNITGLPLTTGVTGTLPVANGGTGIATATAYSPVFTGTTSTGAFQATLGAGTSGQVLTSSGAGVLPVWGPGNGAATDTSAGIVELATTAEVQAGTDTGRVPSVATMRSGLLVLGTTVASTSGTSIDFTSIPSWVKRITINLQGVSANSSSPYVVQIGDSGGIETSGYLGTVSSVNSGAAVGIESFSAGFIINRNGAATDIAHGSVVLTLLDASTNTWTLTSLIALSDSNFTNQTAGSKALTATLDRVRLTTSGGTATFDAGSVNILYE